jgi:hypothetical protein
MRIDALLPQGLLQSQPERIRAGLAQESHLRTQGGRGTGGIGSPASRGFTNEWHGRFAILKEIGARRDRSDSEIAVQVADYAQAGEGERLCGRH